MKKNIAPFTATVVLLLLLMYVGSYLAMVTPGAQINTTPPDAEVNRSSFEMRNYRVGGNLVDQIYWPLEQVDRMLFPGRWQMAFRKSRLFNPLPD